MNFDGITSRLIETGFAHLENRVFALRSIDAVDTVRFDGSFLVGPRKHITLAQLNPVGYSGNLGLARVNLEILDSFFDGKTIDEGWIRSQI